MDSISIKIDGIIFFEKGKLNKKNASTIESNYLLFKKF